MDLSPSDANDPQVTEAYELGRARGAAVVMGQLTVASGRGNISATKTLLSRLDVEPTVTVVDDEAETANLLWPNPSEAANAYELWLESAHKALKDGSASIATVMSVRPEINESERLWLRQHSVALIGYEFGLATRNEFWRPERAAGFSSVGIGQV